MKKLAAIAMRYKATYAATRNPYYIEAYEAIRRVMFSRKVA